MNHETMLTLLKVIPFNILISNLKEAIDEYENVPSDDNKEDLCQAALMVSTKKIVDEKGLDTVMTDIKKTQAAHRLFDFDEN
jgi:hypothetical protein